MVDLPHDAVAIFHCSFHPTRGNVLDWSLTSSSSVDLTNVEFSCLPSGLHTIEEDVVYFSRGDHPGLCVFRRRRTEEHGHRGFRLSSLGVLLAAPTSTSSSTSSSSASTCTVSSPKPWLYTSSLKSLVQTIYASLEHRDILEPTNQDWEPARAWFEQHRLPSLITTLNDQPASSFTAPTPIILPPAISDPSTHLPHILQASSLGPSLLTISRFLLAGRRVLILVKPPVEGACVMCWAIGGLCATTAADNPDAVPSPSTATAPGVRVLGMVTLHDIDRLERPGKAVHAQGSRQGWVACTTDTVFVDKTKCWDLLVDVTSCDFSALASASVAGSSNSGVSSGSEGRPKMYVPRGSLDGEVGDRARKSGKKEGLRFAWSDVKLWTDLARLAPVPDVPFPASINSHTHTHPHSHSHTPGPSSSSSPLSSPPNTHRPPPGPSSLPLALIPPSWLDAGRIYEDACILCAGMWYGSSASSWPDEGQGKIRLNGDDALTTTPTATYDKSKRMSVEHGRRRSPSGDRDRESTVHGSGGKRVERVLRRMSESSTAVFTSRKGKLTETEEVVHVEEIDALDGEGGGEEDGEGEETRRVQAAVSVSRAFAAYHSRLLQRLSLLVEEEEGELSVGGGGGGGGGGQTNDSGVRTVVLSPRDLASLDLGPLSVIDARWVEWLADSRLGVVGSTRRRGGRTVVRVRRARWRDVLGAVFGFS